MDTTCDAWICTRCAGPLMFADVGHGEHETCPEPVPVYRLRLQYRTLQGEWVDDLDPLNHWDGKQCRVIKERAYRFPDKSIQWAPIQEEADSRGWHGKFLTGPTTDTPAALEAMGLSRSTIWRSLARKWYTLGYHESQPREDTQYYHVCIAEGATRKEMKAALYAAHPGITNSAADRAIKTRVLLIHPPALPEDGPLPADTLPAGSGGFAALKNPIAFATRHVLSQLDLWECREEWQEQIPDLTQQALLKCWEKRHQEGVENFVGYFASIVHQAVRDAVRKERHRQTLVPMGAEE